jgi:DNA repair and recombination RAD54-like protein
MGTPPGVEKDVFVHCARYSYYCSLCRIRYRQDTVHAQIPPNSKHTANFVTQQKYTIRRSRNPTPVLVRRLIAIYLLFLYSASQFEVSWNDSVMTKPKSCVSYSVLYYKRAANTKKVYQRKGVTTLDGVLTIHSDSSRIVLRSADGADVPTQNDALNAWSKAAKAPGMLVLSSVQRDVAQQTWSEDDEFTVGPYRIEILKRLDPNENCSPVINNIDIVRGPSVVHGQTVRTGVPMQALPSRTRLPLKRKALPLQSTSTLSLGKRVIGALARKTIPATTPAIGSIAQSCELVKSGIASKCTVDKGTSRTLLPTARPSPPTMVRRTPLVSQSNTTTTTSQSNLKRRTTPLMGLKYTLAKNRAKLASCPATRRYLPGATSTSTIPATNTSPPQSSTNLLANVPLPASVRSVLRPHQEEGVEFLWQALAPMAVSGNEQNDTQSPARGAIFADEMGLGKTLMTIAIIAGLHRRQRDKVRPNSKAWCRLFVLA